VNPLGEAGFGFPQVPDPLILITLEGKAQQMKWYADRPNRFARQVVADVLAVAWAAFWVWFALGARDAVLTVRAPGDGLVSAGSSMHDSFGNAAGKAGDVPFVGKALADALGKGSAAGTTLVDVGNTEIQAVETIALWLAIALIAVPVAFLLITWLPLRLRYARKAGAAKALRDAGRRDLLALHALNNLSLAQLARFDGDPLEGWRRGDEEVLAKLASHQLATVGVRG
jgi:hypothetical protein